MLSLTLLHDAIKLLLRQNPKGMTTTELATKINARGLYKRRDGEPLTATQVSARITTAQYRGFFSVIDGKVFLWQSRPRPR